MSTLVGWAAVTVALMAMANFQSTEKLGASFAYLILIAVIFADFDAFYSKLNPTNKAASQGRPSGTIGGQ